MNTKRFAAVALAIAMLLQLAACSMPIEPTIGINSYTGNTSINTNSQGSPQTSISDSESEPEGSEGNSSDDTSASSESDVTSATESESTSSQNTSNNSSEESSDSDSSSNNNESSSSAPDSGEDTTSSSETSSQPEAEGNTSSSQPDSTEDTTSSENTESQPEPDEPPALGGYKPIADEKRYCLKSGVLNQRQKLLYYNIKNAVKSQKSYLDLSASSAATTADVRLVMQCINTDYPEFYWLSGDFTLHSSGDYITKIEFEYFPFNDAYTAALDKVVEDFCSNIPSNLSDYELELLAHDFICQNVEYDSSSPSVSSNPHAYTAYGALVEGLCVCEGYSRAMQLIINRLGIQCSLVRGSGNGEGHMWNVIEIDSEWYHLDVTWDDPVGAKYYNHFFFNLPTSEILSTGHTIDSDFELLTDITKDFNVKTVHCTETTYNYFAQNGTYLSKSTEEIAIKSAVAKAIESGINYCEFWAGEKSSFCSIAESADKQSALSSILSAEGITSFSLISSNSAHNRFMIYW